MLYHRCSCSLDVSFETPSTPTTQGKVRERVGGNKYVGIQVIQSLQGTQTEIEFDQKCSKMKHKQIISSLKYKIQIKNDHNCLQACVCSCLLVLWLTATEKIKSITHHSAFVCRATVINVQDSLHL